MSVNSKQDDLQKKAEMNNQQFQKYTKLVIAGLEYGFNCNNDNPKGNLEDIDIIYAIYDAVLYIDASLSDELNRSISIDYDLLYRNLSDNTFAIRFYLPDGINITAKIFNAAIPSIREITIEEYSIMKF